MRIEARDGRIFISSNETMYLPDRGGCGLVASGFKGDVPPVTIHDVHVRYFHKRAYSCGIFVMKMLNWIIRIFYKKRESMGIYISRSENSVVKRNTIEG